MWRLPPHLGGRLPAAAPSRGLAAGCHTAVMRNPTASQLLAPRWSAKSTPALGVQRHGRCGCSRNTANVPYHARRFVSTKASTHLGAYLERCGATWGQAQPSEEALAGVDTQAPPEVVVSEEGRCFTWALDLPPSRLASLRRGDALESPAFPLGDERHRGRLQFFPKGDGLGSEGFCSLWLWTDYRDLGAVRLRLGGVEKDGGASDYCKLEDVWQGGKLEAGLRVDPVSIAPSGASGAGLLQQSLQMTGLQAAEWQIFNIKEVMSSPNLVSSAPFRFHHVLLGDMYLELLPGENSPDFCTLFFRCRVPTMKMQVHLAVGTSFSKSFVSEGRATHQEDLQHDRCMQVNLDVPGVLGAGDVLTVRCTLEQLVSVPRNLQEMMPKLDERALWPKRL